MHDNDPLVSCLAELAVELDKENIPVVLGGGLSQYLRGKLNTGRSPSPRYPFTASARSTEDLDLFLSPRLIVDAAKMEGLKLGLLRLGYTVRPEARNFQFGKTIPLYGQSRPVKVDLLAAPPADTSEVAIKKPRIKPKDAEGIHAYLTDESEGIELGKIPVPSELLATGLKLTHNVIFIPSVFNFLVLKLHAFNDSKNNPEKDFGRHHAWDIFAAVAGMAEPDWAAARTWLKPPPSAPRTFPPPPLQASCVCATTKPTSASASYMTAPLSRSFRT